MRLEKEKLSMKFVSINGCQVVLKYYSIKKKKLSSLHRRFLFLIFVVIYYITPLSESSLQETEEEFPPPPSPVSSSYSELRRAAQYQQDYATYAPSSQVNIDNYSSLMLHLNR